MRGNGGCLGQLVFSLTVFTVNMLFLGIAGVMRLLPLLLPIMGRVAWGLLLLTCRLYYLLITRAAPWVKKQTKVNILAGLPRLAAIILLSLTLGGVFLIIAQWPISLWTVGPLVLHALFVDFVWDDIPQNGNLQMGVRI